MNINDIFLNNYSLTIWDYTLIPKQSFIKICLIFITSSINYIYKTMKFLEHESENTPKEAIFNPGFTLNC